jgi:hypothetical protein
LRRFIGGTLKPLRTSGLIATSTLMRAEIQKIVDEIKQSVSLLRRHL